MLVHWILRSCFHRSYESLVSRWRTSGHFLSKNCHKPAGINHNNIAGYLDCYEVKTDRGKHYQEEGEIDRSYEKCSFMHPLLRNRYTPHEIVQVFFLADMHRGQAQL